MTDSEYGDGNYGGAPTPRTAEEIVDGAMAMGQLVLLDQMPVVLETLLNLRHNLADARAALDVTEETIADLRGRLDDANEELAGTNVRARQFAEDLMKETKAHQATQRALDTAEASNEEAQELLAEAHRTIAVQAVELGDLEQQRADDRLTIADLEQRLADCQGGQP